MPGSARPVTDETDGLLEYLAQQRLFLKATVHGLTEEQATTRSTVSALDLAGLIKHVAGVEQTWIVGTMMQRPVAVMDESNYEAGFHLQPGETLAEVIAFYDAVAAETEAIVRSLPDLEWPVPVPDAPWFPKDVEHWSARWVLLHVIEETARHTGHADIIREAIDGRGGFELLADYEGLVPAWA
jgi:hypothetical protein